MKLGPTVFIRKPKPNELGFKDGKVGSERGPSILISQSLKGFFPPLSEYEYNDRKSISMCIEGSSTSILLNYIYFNSKKFLDKKNGRDEKRIYISKQHYDFFFPGDYYVFYKVYLESDIYFYVKRVKQGTDQYKKIAKLISEDDHSLNTEESAATASLLEVDQILGTVNPPVSVEDDIDEKVIKSLNHEVEKADVSTEKQGALQPSKSRPRIDLEEDDDLELFENSSFRKLVLFFYGKKCAISDNNLIYKQWVNLEAAHIKWHAEGGLSHPSNGIPLCRDLHWAFDRGMFTLELDSNNEYKIKVHPSMMECDYLACFNDKSMRKPHDSRYLPKAEYLEWHKENIYGNFSV